MRSRARLTCLSLTLALLFALMSGSVIQAQGPVRVQAGFLLDGSRSISGSNFDIMVNALASVIGDPLTAPRDGTLEICVVQFGSAPETSEVRVEIPPTVVTEGNVATLVAAIRAIQQGRGYTPTGPGIRLITEQMRSSPNFGTALYHAINIATDGVPSDPVSFPGNVVEGSLADAIAAASEAQAAGIDELDIEAVGQTWDFSSECAFCQIVFPKPAVIVPPGQMSPGFVRVVREFSDFEFAIREKMPVLLYTPTPTSTPIPTSTPVPPPTAVPPTPTPEEIPEPSSLMLLAGGLFALGGFVGLRRLWRAH
ncbi:MAG: VWA domain-containing protein [Chloroflexi bacterium]|nr:VWA domain-containing protein [Chloroflexota bacterium]